MPLNITSELIRKADSFAKTAHITQKRKDSSCNPYILHPREVAWILQLAGVTDENVICAALLHDTIEDTKVTKEDLTKEFGDEITNLVLECSDDKSLSKVERKRAQCIHGEHMSNGALLVKIADKISNIQSELPKSWTPEIKRGYIQWSYMTIKRGLELNERLKMMFQWILNDANINLDEINESSLEVYYNLI